jgi:hypothetical protein
MSQPEVLRSELGEETVTARVGLGGEDALFVTPSRLVVYRGEGLLSDESVETYPHGAERVAVSEGRRKAKVTLDYGLDGQKVVQLPTSAVDEALHHVLAGVLDAGGVLADDERVTHTFRFSELTLVVTDRRVAKHVGTAVWDEEFEGFAFDDVTDLAFEEGSVATSVVLTLGDRQERFKTPNASARRVREAIESALFDYHDVRDVEAFREKVAPEPGSDADPTGAAAAGADGDGNAAGGSVDFGEGPDPLSANPAELSDEPANATRSDDAGSEGATAEAVDGAGTTDAGGGTADDAGPGPAGDVGETGTGTGTGAGTGAGTGDGDGDEDGGAPAGAAATGSGDATTEEGFDETGFEPADDAGSEAALAELQAELSALRSDVEALRETVESQGERLDRQNELVEQLVAELRQGR